MNIKNQFKKGVAAATIVGATLLPLKGNSQNIEQSTDKTKSELVENAIKKNIIKHNGKSILINESYEEIVNMSINNLFIKYGKDAEAIYSFYMMEEINKRRADLGIAPLQHDKTLENVCKRFSQYLAEKQKMGHMVEGKRSIHMGINTDKFIRIRENLAVDNVNYSTIKETIDIRHYMDDEKDEERGVKRNINLNHKTPLISPDVDKFGCGFSINGKRVYIVMNSGK